MATSSISIPSNKKTKKLNKKILPTDAKGEFFHPILGKLNPTACGIGLHSTPKEKEQSFKKLAKIFKSLSD